MSFHPDPNTNKKPRPPGMPLEDVRRLIALFIDPLAKANWNTTSTPSHTVLQEMFADGQSNP